MTPHIEAKLDEISKKVILPGDPLRAKYIADNFLQDVKLVNKVRNMYAYTGKYNNETITVMGSGMGMPSVGIYAYELYKIYNVESIIRIGSCGVFTDDLNLLDTILVENSYTEGNFAYTLNNEDVHIASANMELNKKIENIALQNNLKIVKANTLCSEVFEYYVTDLKILLERLPKDLNLKASEMEAFALFYIAKMLNKQASCLLTVVDSHIKNQQISSQDREKSLNDMITLALKTFTN